MTDDLTITVVQGVEGPSLYVNDYRVAGPKPWGGGEVMAEWRLPRSRLNVDLGVALRKASGPSPTASGKEVVDVG